RAPTARGIDADALAAAVRDAGGIADAVADVDTAIEHLLGQAEDDDLIVVAGTNPVVGRIRTIVDEL
ncbi:MAG: deoxyribodipyrimidine photo-lyase, partial [Ilumatobacteraceae bacterium]